MIVKRVLSVKERVKMDPFEVLITKTVYDKDDMEKTPEIIFGPKLIFAYDKDSATMKATIESGISSDDVENVHFYVRNFS